MNYQQRVTAWAVRCFGPGIVWDRRQRNVRFLEEALELVQAAGLDRAGALGVVEYVYGRPAGDVGQEVGGVLTTLATLCAAHGIDMAAEGERELVAVWQRIDQIRLKQTQKPR